MERHLCIHGHFYQPPRENPWLEAVEIQDSAHPYHDWNERITAECYAPNAATRILDGHMRIVDIISNYSRISFNFGPTVLSWMENNTPEVYSAIIESDKLSMQWRSGHGNAVAQAYNHIIMPLANRRDKTTQVIWGIKDFRYRFGRDPEGMWLPETAVDIETLEVLAENSITYTILAPRQASRIRKTGTGKWRDVKGSRIDPSMPYICRLPSGRKIVLFFYDGPISQAVAFEKLLNRGENFAYRLLSGFSDLRQWPQVLSIATDGESYGHHHRFGDMALAHAINYIESNGLARLSNYGEYLEKHPPTHEVEIFERSSWSCVHGIERWRADCGCNSGGYSHWNQQWRLPLREALDWLREQIAVRYEFTGKDLLKNPWQARDEYISVVLDRSQDNIDRFFKKHSRKQLSREERVTALKLLEMQRHAMLMYTSCGWFFDELSGLETVQIMQYAGRAIQLCENILKVRIEDQFKVRLGRAISNMPEHGDGARIYDKFVKPAMIDLKKVGAHFAVSSLFTDYMEKPDIFSYQVSIEDYNRIESGRTTLAIGRISVISKITRDSEVISFCVIHMGDHALNGGVRTFIGDQAYSSMKAEITRAFEQGAFADIIRLMDKHFGMNNYSLAHLFRDKQRKILKLIMGQTLEDFRAAYRNMYNSNRLLMGFFHDTGMPVPKEFRAAAGFTLNFDIGEMFLGETVDVDRVQELASDMKRWNFPLDSVDIEFAVRHRLEIIMKTLQDDPGNIGLMTEVRKILEVIRLLPVEINYWQVQNYYYRMAKTVYPEFSARADKGEADAVQWRSIFKYIGEMLYFDINAVLEDI
ncbi:MAG: DUF3536 domain-containing protein [Nitrospiraceae bacterium]|nr:MAG: DUF3536 domain-containing protein [Nitrospiraceae bacterium]